MDGGATVLTGGLGALERLVVHVQCGGLPILASGRLWAHWVAGGRRPSREGLIRSWNQDQRGGDLGAFLGLGWAQRSRMPQEPRLERGWVVVREARCRGVAWPWGRLRASRPFASPPETSRDHLHAGLDAQSLRVLPWKDGGHRGPNSSKTLDRQDGKSPAPKQRPVDSDAPTQPVSTHHALSNAPRDPPPSH